MMSPLTSRLNNETHKLQLELKLPNPVCPPFSMQQTHLSSEMTLDVTVCVPLSHCLWGKFTREEGVSGGPFDYRQQAYLFVTITLKLLLWQYPSTQQLACEYCPFTSPTEGCFTDAGQVLFKGKLHKSEPSSFHGVSLTSYSLLTSLLLPFSPTLYIYLISLTLFSFLPYLLQLAPTSRHLSTSSFLIPPSALFLHPSLLVFFQPQILRIDSAHRVSGLPCCVK